MQVGQMVLKLEKPKNMTLTTMRRQLSTSLSSNFMACDIRAIDVLGHRKRTLAFPPVRENHLCEAQVENVIEDDAPQREKHPFSTNILSTKSNRRETSMLR